MVAASGEYFGALLPWLGGLTIVAFVGALIMGWTRRMAVGKGTKAGTDGFSLDDLRGLVERGELTADEFELARKRMIDRARTTVPTKPPPSGKGP